MVRLGIAIVFLALLNCYCALFISHSHVMSAVPSRTDPDVVIGTQIKSEIHEETRIVSIKKAAEGIAGADEGSAEEVPALPAPSDYSEGPTRVLQLGGDAVKMDDLGPIIINTDGTTRRIANWQTLTPAEQKNTIRLISARNKKRIEALQEKMGQSEQEMGHEVNASESETL